MAPMLRKAIAQESDVKVKALLVEVYALATLKDPDKDIRLAAVTALATSADPNNKSVLFEMSKPENEAETAVRMAAFRSYLQVKQRQTVVENVGRVFSGLSLASILLLAAMGLAITYGVMGVINMAHGELLMIGAYATFGVSRSHSSLRRRSAWCWNAR